jgi:hypothetical protein
MKGVEKMISNKNIFIEKLTESLPDYYLNGENHTNYCIVTKCNTWKEVEECMDENNWNFLGISTPPYNPYGKHLNFAFVIEDISDDYKILWHHVSDMWLDKIAESLEIEYRFRKKKTGV